MSSCWSSATLGQLIQYRKEFIRIDDLKMYKRCRVRLHGKGIVLRDEVLGATLKTKDQQVCQAGELLVAEIDAKVGGFGIVPEALDGAIVSSHYFLFSLDDERIDRRFLDYYIRTPGFTDQVAAQGSTNYAAIRPNQVLNYKIPYPPLVEQRQIVAKIDELAAKIEEARTLRQKATEETGILVTTALNSIFDDLFASCQMKHIGEICEVVRGGSPRPAGSPVYYGGDIPFIKVGDITKDDGKYLYAASESVNELGRKHSRYIEENTLMLTNSGATLGVPKITKISGCFNDGSQAFLNLSQVVEKEFLFYFFKSKTEWLRGRLARGQGQPNLNTYMTREMEIPIPPLSEQRRIVAELDALEVEVNMLKHMQVETSAELDALLPSILDKAFKGEL